jgi:hypothetical protein
MTKTSAHGGESQLAGAQRGSAGPVSVGFLKRFGMPFGMAAIALAAACFAFRS